MQGTVDLVTTTKYNCLIHKAQLLSKAQVRNSTTTSCQDDLYMSHSFPLPFSFFASDLLPLPLPLPHPSATVGV